VRFGLFYEHQLPRPWAQDGEARLLADALEQVELADRVGFDSVWVVEHHFLEEYSHSSAPEVFLAAASQRTSRIRLGHGIVQIPPGYNHPARVAERVATLDLVSGGRVEFGTGESSSQAELGGFGVPRDDKRAQWEESLDAITRMFVEEPFAGYDGRWLRMPPRNVVPKPAQRPHPPLWVACSRRETILLAARKGIGALSFSFVEPEQAREWVDEYERVLTSEQCVPAGFAVNPQVAVVVPMMCHRDEATAIERGIDGAHFFGYSLTHYYVFGQHRPGRTNVWDEFEANRREMGFARELIRPGRAPLGVNLLQEGLGSLRGAIGTPDQIRDLVRRYEAAGVDQVIFVSQAGRNLHEHVCESISLFASEVLPEFASQADEREAAKRERLAEACERALARREPARSAPDYVIAPADEPRAAPALVPAAPEAAASSRARGRAAERMRGLRDRARIRAGAAREGVERRAVEFLSGRSDDQVERILLSRPGLAQIMRGMERSFRPEKRQGFTGFIQYELSPANGDPAAPGGGDGGDGAADDGVRPFAVKVTAEGASARAARIDAPALTLRMTAVTFGRILTGQLDPGLAFMQGRIGMEGDVALALRMGELFGARDG
jgi:alkanesulfonate monooxygenase SsuD/methylene tetrahydromethanopterin reductase-like flavin-dependent oxidoreductase (luciferase family)